MAAVRSSVRLIRLHKKRSRPAVLLMWGKKKRGNLKHSRNPHVGSIKGREGAFKKILLGKVMHGCNPSTPEPEAGELPQV